MVTQISDPDNNAALNNLKRDIFINMNCVQVGIIQDFDSATQTATVIVSLKSVVEVKPDGTQVLQERAAIGQVPVVMLYGGGSYLTFPIAPGDNCLVLFNDREIDQWLYNGDGQVPVSDRAHDISDAIALVGLRSLQNSIASYLTNGVRLAFDSATHIDVKNALIETFAALMKQNGNMEITGNLLVDGNTHIIGGLQVDGVCTGSGGGAFKLGANLDMNSHTLSGGVVQSSNGATGTYTNSVTVANGIVTGGT